MFTRNGAQIMRNAHNVTDEEEEAKERFFEALIKKDAVALEEVLKKKERHNLVNMPNHKGALPLNLACVNGADQIVHILLAKGADIRAKDKDGWTCLHSACSVERNTKVLKLIIAQDGLDYNARTSDGSTPLHFFARYSAINRDLVYLFEIIVSSGGEINAQNNSGETPLHRAVTRLKGDLLMTELLLKNGADPNITTTCGEMATPLHLALLTAPLKVKNDNATSFIVEMLLFHGANIDAVTSKKRTPLDLAVENKLAGPTMAIRREKALREWLTDLQLLHLHPEFRAHRIDLTKVKNLDEKTLVSMGITDESVQKKLLDNLDKAKPVEEVMYPLDLPSKRPKGALISSGGLPPKQASEAVLMLRSAKAERMSRILEQREKEETPTPGSRKLKKSEKKNLTEQKSPSMSDITNGGSTKPRAMTVASTAAVQQEPRTPKRWEISLDEVDIASSIGEGGAGSVFKGEWRGIPVALKKLKDQALRADQIQMFIEEIDLMSELRHPNIIQFLGASLEPGNMFFITQLAEKGNLHDVVTKEDPPFKKRVQYMRDIARGMNYLHQNNPPIVHRDLKSMNILIDAHHKACLCDFGISKQVSGSKVTGKGAFNGTFYWMAPDEKQTVRSDVYSYGLVMWEALTGKFPYDDYKLSQLIIKVHTQGERPPIPEGTHPDYVNLMQRCWAQDPALRPLFPEILKTLDTLLSSLPD